MDPVIVILMRAGLAEESEYNACLDNFWSVYQNRSAVPAESLVVGRYSVLPYYSELFLDLYGKNSHLINSPKEHEYIADLQEWYADLEGLTPRTWFSLFDYKLAVEEFSNGRPRGARAVDGGKPVVLKGQTNSKKHQWKTHMFATSATEVDEVYKRLSEDSLTGEQSIYIREFIKFASYDVESISGMPVTDEYRFFVCKGEIVAKGFYWSEHEQAILDSQVSDRKSILVPSSAVRFVQDKVIPKIKHKAPFVVVDVAREGPSMGENTKWWVVELNDGQMSGLSGCSADDLYQNLKNVLVYGYPPVFK